LGTVYKNAGAFAPAIDAFEQQLALARAIGNPRIESHALGNLGIVAFHQQQISQAIAYHEQALTISREISDRQGEGTALGNLGNAYAAIPGKTSTAIICYEQHLRIAEDLSDRQSVGLACWNLGIILTQQRDKPDIVDRGIGLMEQSIAIHRELDSPKVQALEIQLDQTRRLLIEQAAPLDSSCA
jgi:tetratricopeptide (TPR) repeat protein